MKSRRIITYVIICCLFFSSISILTSSYNLDNSIQSQPNSYSNPDSIHIEVRTKIENSAEDVANGQLDSFLWSISGKTYDSLSSDVKERTGKWRSEYGYNTIYFNPAHTASPYECSVDGKIRFNPFAIQEVRYAANFLLDRKEIINDFYNDHGEPRYLPFSQSSPAYEDHYEKIVEERGFTAEGSKQKGIEMVQQGLTSAMNDPELKGELKPPSNMSQFWEYKPPNGTFEPLEVRGIIRIEDEREEIGEYFSDLLRDCNIKVDERKNYHISYGAIVWSSDPAELQWNFYTGGWLSNRAEYYGDIIPAQMYSGWFGYMPGGFVSSADYRYGCFEDGAEWFAEGNHGEFYGNLTLENITKRLYEGQINSEEQYWDYMERAIDLGFEEAVRIYICSEHEYYLYNRSRVGSASTNVLSGWDDIFTPRTIEISKEDLNLAHYSAQGTLFMDNWNELVGSSDIYGLSMKRMLMDVGTTLHPSSGKPVPVRCNWYEEENWYEKRKSTPMVKKDYTWKTNETGDLVLNRNISVPENAVIYNSTANQWEEVGPGVRSAVKVTYSVVGGKWHSGANLTLKDVMGWHAWSWEMSFKDESNDEYYHEGFGDKNEDRFRSIKGEHWDKENQTYTIWGDYTRPIDSKIGYYYSIWPAVPYYQYEAAQFLVNQNDEYIPSDTGTYSWDNYEEHWIHWLSEEQGQDIVDTLQNMIEKEYIPWYMRVENNSPINVSYDELKDEIQGIIDFYDQYNHVFVSNGPFLAKNVTQGTVNFTRFSQEDGYPFTQDDLIYMSDSLSPTADAGEDRVVNEGTEVTFNGDNSYDDTGVQNYTWLIEEKDYHGVEVNHTFEEPGVYSIVLNVTDLIGNYDEDVLNITVKDNTPPTAEAGKDRTVGIGEQFKLDASNSTDNGKIVSYSWRFIDKTKEGKIVHHEYSKQGIYTVELTVVDGSDLTDRDTVKITVIKTDNIDPTAEGGEDRTVQVGEKVKFDASDSSDNNEIVSYVWDLDNGENLTGKRCNYTFNETGTYNVKLTVKDLSGNTDTDTIKIKVEEKSDGGTPGFLLIVLLAGTVLALIIGYSKLRSKGGLKI